MRELKIALVVVVVLLLLCTAATLGVLILQPQLLTPVTPPVEAAEGPAILIDRPGHGDQVFVGQAVQVLATGYDPNKIERMQLWVDGEIVVSQASAFPQGMNPFPLLATWIPETLGSHTVVVRGYNMNGVTGEASLTLSAVEAPEIATELPQEGCAGVVVIEHQVRDDETLEGVAAQYEVTVEEILACNPALDPTAPLGQGDTLLVPYLATPEEEEPLSPDVALPVAQLPPEVEDEPGEELPPPEEEPQPGEAPPEDPEELPEGPADLGPVSDPPRAVLEVEARDLQTDQPYSAGYCLVRLGDGEMEWVPGGDDLFLPPDGASYWEIVAELGGVDKSRTVPVYGDTLRVEMHCYAFRDRADAEPIYLGKVIRDHAELDWTGELLEATSEDGEEGGWFLVRYRLCPGTCYPERELPAPYALGMDLIAGNPYLRWQWDGDPETIDGWFKYRNGAFVARVPGPEVPTGRLSESDLYPPCGEVYRFQISAHRGSRGYGIESPLSAPFQVPPTGPEPCAGRRVLLRFGDLHTGCLPADCGQAAGGGCSDCLLNLWYGFITANRELLTHLPPECPNGVCAWAGPVLKSFSCSDAPYNIFTPCLWPPASTAELFDGQDALVVNLGEGEDLNIGILLMDRDRSGRDLLLCEGRKAFSASEMENWEDDPPPPYLLSCTKGGELVAYLVVDMMVQALPLQFQ